MKQSATETYLRRATWGLWGRKRREVREELEAHLSERVMAHRIGGLAEADAVGRALTELGSPQEVSMGMTRLYTLPTVMGSSLALAAAFVTVVALLPNGVAQSPVMGSFFWPSEECAAALRADSILRPYQKCEVLDNSIWLDPQALTKTLEEQGVAVGRSDEMLTLTFPDTPPVQVPLGAPAITISDLLTTLDEASITNDLLEAAVSGEEIGAVPGALSLWTMLKEVSVQTDLPIQIEGYDNPVVGIGNASFQVGTEIRTISGDNFYTNYLENVFYGSLIDRLFLDGGVLSTNLLEYTDEQVRGAELEVTAAEPGVYGVVSVLDLGTFVGAQPPEERGVVPLDLYISLEAVQVDGGERFMVKLPEEPVRFVESFSSDTEAGTAVLVRLAGGSEAGGWFEVVSPERINHR